MNIKKTFDVNVLGTLNILKASSNSNKSITFLSLPNLTDHTPYALSKSCADRFAQMYLNFKNLDVSILRLFNCFGEFQDLKSGKLIINTIHKALNNNDILINGNGQNKLNFIYINDAVNCIINSINSHKKGIYYIGSDKEVSVKEIVNKILDLSNSKSRVKFLKNRVGEVNRDLIFEKNYNRISVEKYTDFNVSIKSIINTIRK